VRQVGGKGLKLDVDEEVVVLFAIVTAATYINSCSIATLITNMNDSDTPRVNFEQSPC
jgi:hypothetical protein